MSQTEAKGDRIKLLGCAVAFVALPLLAFAVWAYATPALETLLRPPIRGPLLLGLAAALISYAAWLLWNTLSQHRWATVTGTVEVSEVQRRVESVPEDSIHGGWRIGDRQFATFHHPLVQYRYVVGGQEHVGEWGQIPYVRGAKVSIGKYSDQVTAERVVAAYPIAAKVKVYVHPRFPALSTLTPGRLWARGAVLIAMGSLLLAASAFLW